MFALVPRKSLFTAKVNKPVVKYSNQTGIVTTVSLAENRIRVKFDATEWFAQSEQVQTLQPGDFVRVVGRMNATTLLVEPTSRG
jgi:membrane protein implicated in regulation of membrane protease activity